MTKLTDNMYNSAKTVSYFYDKTGYMMLLTYQKYDIEEGEGQVYTDYTECEITYTSGAGGEDDNTYTYDVDLKRIKKDMNGTIQKFIYDGANVVAEYNSENTLQASYITPGLDQNLTIKRSGNTTVAQKIQKTTQTTPYGLIC